MCNSTVRPLESEGVRTCFKIRISCFVPDLVSPRQRNQHHRPGSGLAIWPDPIPDLLVKPSRRHCSILMFTFHTNYFDKNDKSLPQSIFLINYLLLSSLSTEHLSLFMYQHPTTHFHSKLFPLGASLLSALLTQTASPGHVIFLYLGLDCILIMSNSNSAMLSLAI